MSNVIQTLGGPTAIAVVLGIKRQSVISWNGVIPVDRRVELERARYPTFSVEMAGKDAAWRRVTDPGWPHPDGRPCLDLIDSHGLTGLATRPRVASAQAQHAA